MAVESARRGAGSRRTSHSRNTRSRVSTSLTRSNIQRITGTAIALPRTRYRAVSAAAFPLYVIRVKSVAILSHRGGTD
jgi:hypothetical protein